VNPRLEGYAAAVLQAPDADVRRLAEDLVAVERTVIDNRALRAALTDTAIPPRARRAVVEDLLSDRVAPGVRRVVGFAAEAVVAPEVPSAISWLAQRAQLLVDDRQLGAAPLAHGQARQRVGGFATAQLEGLGVAQLEEVEDELFRFARIVESTPALRAVLTDRDTPVAVRRRVVDALLVGKAQDVTVRLAEYVVVGGRPRDTVGTLDWLVEQTALARGWRVARVRAAAGIDGDERERLVSSLTRLTGRPVEMQVTVDPSLLAGVVLEVGDLRVDASARGRLQALREHMSPANWHRPATAPERETSDENEGAR
jgi:F-type H+-transporting ATPase subunit delta